MKSLPQGLVSTAEGVPSELDDLDVVDPDDIKRLWRVYSTNPSVHEGDIGHRLENFFWRIWSSKQLCSSLDGSTLARLFLRISESNPFSIITLRQMKMARDKASQPDMRIENKPNEQLASGAKRAPLHPILKKSSVPSGEPHKTTRLLLTGLEGQSITRNPSNPPTPVPPSQPTMLDFNRPAPKKTVFVAGKAKSIKRRPVIMRRKSSQTYSTGGIRAQSPQQMSKPLGTKTQLISRKQDDSSDSETEAIHIEHVVPHDAGDDDTDKPPELPAAFLSNLKGILTEKRTPPQSAKSTPPKWGFVTTDDWTHYDVRYLSPENYKEQPSSASLVDSGFRSRFTEQVDIQKEYLATSPGESTKEGLLQFLYSKSVEANASPLAQLGSSAGASTTMAGIPIMTPNDTPSTLFSNIGLANSAPFPTLLTPFSLTNGRSGLSMLIEESRKKEEESNAATHEQLNTEA
ncbi:hypothetical protein BDV25DRAFT_159384 [Aspergillus avenaceus]|uniref:Nitrogen regulatory protein areA GATA-like domain-containing protein n=1 Tax=Aspergillus avenaceus TaxID=36643 RepID=A0A5N6TNJ5_ASPAV|nr:hypothetical protein BDV25DRAFT_159384 [Aspergillus avenaceus]